MSELSTPLPLTLDFAERLEALRVESAGGGHSDLDHLLEMAVTIARQRAMAQNVPAAMVDSDILQPQRFTPA